MEPGPPPRTPCLLGAAQLLQREVRSWNSPGAWGESSRPSWGGDTCWVMSGALSLRAACGWWRVGSPPSPAGCAGGFLLPTPSPAWFKNCCLEGGSPPACPPARSQQAGSVGSEVGEREEMRSEPHPRGRGSQALGNAHGPLPCHPCPAAQLRPEVTSVPTCLVLGASQARRRPCCPPCSSPTSLRPPVGLAAGGSGPPSGQPCPRVGLGVLSSVPLEAGSPPVLGAPPQSALDRPSGRVLLCTVATELLNQKVGLGALLGSRGGGCCPSTGQLDPWSVNRPLTLNRKVLHAPAKTCCYCCCC